MKSQYLTKHRLPDAPGVYLFKKGKQILYIGKATSLKSRVKSYFSKDISETRGPRIVGMVETATALAYRETPSILEALMLEAELIKRHQPPYNSSAKDDKSWNYCVITKEKFPRVLVLRGKELPFFDEPIKFQAGPFPYGGELKEAMKIVRKIFPYRDMCIPFQTALRRAQNKSCFNAQIGLCPGVCDGRMNARDYARTVRNLILFFRGKQKELTRTLTREMKTRADAQDFEGAARLRNQLFAFSHIRDVSLLKRADRAEVAETRIEAYDVSHISGASGVGVMVVMQGGLLAKGEYRKFRLYAQKNDDTGALAEVLARRLRHPEWPQPSLIVVDGGAGQKNAAEQVLNKADFSIPVVAVTKDERHKAHHIIGESALVRDHHDDILAINAEAHRFAIAYHRRLREKIKK